MLVTRISPRWMAERMLDGGGEIEDVADAFAIGLEKDRERGEARGDGEKVGGAFALLPERSALTGAAAREEGERGQAASRNFAAKSEVEPSCCRTSCWNSVGSGRSCSDGISSSLSGMRRTKPSSDHIDSTSSPRSARSLALTAMHHGA